MEVNVINVTTGSIFHYLQRQQGFIRLVGMIHVHTYLSLSPYAHKICK